MEPVPDEFYAFKKIQPSIIQDCPISISVQMFSSSTHSARSRKHALCDVAIRPHDNPVIAILHVLEP